jgi:hypothetical protein
MAAWPASVSANTRAGRPAPARTPHRLLTGLEVAGGEQRVEVAAHRGAGQTEPRGEGGGGRRAVLEDHARDAVPGPGVDMRVRRTRRRGDGHVFHNASVS